MNARVAVLAFFVVASGVALVILLSAPPAREAAGFSPPASIQGSAGLVFEKENAGITFPAEAGAAQYFSYRLRKIGAEESDVRFHLVYFRSANSDARTLPALAIPPVSTPRPPPEISITAQNWTGGRGWIEFEREGGRFRGVRISPEGNCSVTKSELWRMRFANWAAHPMRLLRWLFTSEMLVDRRAFWLEMTMPNGAVTHTEEVDAIWAAAIDSFALQVRVGFCGK